MKHKIIVAGIGPGHPDYIVPRALDVIKNAHFLVGGSRALAQFARKAAAQDDVQADVQKITSLQETMPIKADIAAVMAFIREKLAIDDVVVMVSGDPGYYSLLDALRREFDEACIEVIAGISSMQLAFAKLALPWHDAELLSFHGRVPSEEKLIYREGRIIGMLTDGTYNSQTIPQRLMELGWPPTAKLAICARLSYKDEVIIRTTLAEAGNFPIYTHCILVVIG